ncbi:hypothetical protein KKG45_01755 [bacterium]|nr:hypothetical protein [bacterium]
MGSTRMCFFGRRTTIGLAVVLMMSLETLEYAHIRHHLLEAEAHTADDRNHQHDDHACAIFHEGLLTEIPFALPEPSVPVVPVVSPEAPARPCGSLPLLPPSRAPPVAS